MAEYLLKDMIERRGIQNWKVESAGISVLPGVEANPKAVKVMAEEGISLTEHCAQKPNRELLANSDIILTMTGYHKEYLEDYMKNIIGIEIDKLFTLKNFLDQKEADIFDPIGQPLSVYRDLRDDLKDYLEQLLVKLNHYFSNKGKTQINENNINKRCENMKIAIGSDHAGYNLKRVVINYLEQANIDYQDLGTDSDKSVDYPDFGVKVAQSVADGKCDKGILICGTGIGMSMVANKIKGIRAALCHDVVSAKATRNHNDSNVLTMGARIIGQDLALEIVKTWLESDFLGDDQPRHQRRIDKIEEASN